MNVDDTRKTLDAYLDALTGGGDFAAYFDDEVSWTTTETGERVTGREEVRDLILALHTRMFHASPEVRNVVVGEGRAALEAVFVGVHAETFGDVPATGAKVRSLYSVFYDLEDGRITALRAYFPVTALVQELRKAVPSPD